jgi:hypothetical protein
MKSRLARIGRVALITTAVAASLLTFPNAIPWMVAAWLLWHTLLVFRHRPGWLPLAVCVTILGIKGVDWSPGLILVAILMLILGLSRVCTTRGWTSGKKHVVAVAIAIAWVAWAGMTWTWYASTHCGRSLAIQSARPIACLGDSLTAYGYPKLLREMVSLPVVDLGCDGIATDDALRRLPSLLEANPQVVVIELGGHDYLKGYRRATARKNLERIIEACRAIGAEVILVEIPRGFVTDPFQALEREMARQLRLELIPDTAIRRLVLWSPSVPPGLWMRPELRLSDDGLHPNARGNRLLAEYVVGALERIYGSDVRARPSRCPARGPPGSSKSRNPPSSAGVARARRVWRGSRRPLCGSLRKSAWSDSAR